jgi:hypothetical protein
MSKCCHLGELWPRDKDKRQQEQEADHSPPSSGEVRNGAAIPPLPHTSSWRGAQLMKPIDTFTLTYLDLVWQVVPCTV